MSQGYKAINLIVSRLLERHVEIGISRLQGYQGYKGGMQGQDSQGYKAIKATGGVCRDEFRKASRLSRLLEGGAGLKFSRLQGYQGYMRGMQG